jgi:hypothetical protein
LAPLHGAGGGWGRAEDGGDARPAWPREEDGVDGPARPSGPFGNWAGVGGKREGAQWAGPAWEKWAGFWKEKKKRKINLELIFKLTKALENYAR